ncbi:hypothetical protein AAZX31_12G139600 [Glycine max]
MIFYSLLLLCLFSLFTINSPPLLSSLSIVSVFIGLRLELQFNILGIELRLFVHALASSCRNLLLYAAQIGKFGKLVMVVGILETTFTSWC